MLAFVKRQSCSMKPKRWRKFSMFLKFVVDVQYIYTFFSIAIAAVNMGLLLEIDKKARDT